ncbi:hypothetical protein SUGI_0916850 [Cryptomeria japonica]|nr:hypothetical protein SUGI_0916850 [Cryptomeria japonica]
MGKGIYVFLLFLLLTPPFAASDMCRNPSGGFHGQCVAWRWDECNDICVNQDHQLFGECDWWNPHGLACWCFHQCP